MNTKLRRAGEKQDNYKKELNILFVPYELPIFLRAAT